MAVNPPPPEPADPDDAPAAGSAIPLATATLRARADERWVEISDRVLAKALKATRRSYPVLAQASTGPVHVSEQVLISHLRAAIDEEVQGSPVVGIDIQVSGGDVYTAVTIRLVAAFGQPLLPIADHVREVALAVLTTRLGPVSPPVTLETMHVHFSDVRTRG